MNCRVHELELKLQLGTSPYGPGQKLAIGGAAGTDYDYGNDYRKKVMVLKDKLPATWYTGENDSDCTDVEEPTLDFGGNETDKSSGYETDSTLTTLNTTPTTPSPFKKPTRVAGKITIKVKTPPPQAQKPASVASINSSGKITIKFRMPATPSPPKSPVKLRIKFTPPEKNPVEKPLRRSTRKRKAPEEIPATVSPKFSRAKLHISD